MMLSRNAHEGEPMRSLKSFVLLLMLGLVFQGFSTEARADSIVVRSAQGKKLVTVDADGLRIRQDDKVVASIDVHSSVNDNFSILNAAGKRTLYFQGGFVYSSADDRLRLATVDGDDIRHGDRGKVVMNYHHPDLSPTAHDNRMFLVEDGELNVAQLVAVLYVIKPDLFALSADEQAAQLKSYKAAEEANNKAFQDVLVGRFEVANSDVDEWSSGLITTTRGKDDVHYLDMKLKGAELAGIAVQRTVFADKELWVAFAPKGAVALAVYEIDGGKLNGTWVPINAAKDGKGTFGTEQLDGPAGVSGDYAITAAKGPNGGAAYTGSLNIKRFEPQGGNGSDFQDTYLLTWTIGATKIYGIGAKVKYAQGKEALIAASGSTADFAVGHVRLESATSVKGIDFVNSKFKGGYIVVTRQND
jgi:hypothetical protein